VPAAPAAVFGLPEWAGRLALVGLVLAGALLLLWAVAIAMPRLSRRAAAGRRARQRQTAISALATGLRYLVLVAAAIAIAFAVAGGSGLAALSGGALVVVVVGFASQRLLMDVIAGFFILFEDQYGIGDVIRLEPSGATGRVETLGLRTTVLVGAGGERAIVPNGQITAVRLIPGGRRRYRLEMLTRDPDALQAIVGEVAGAVAGAGGPWDASPRIVCRDLEGDLVRVIAIVEVAAEREGAAEAWLPQAIAARAGDLLLGPPLAVMDPGAG
jgi:small-conductance mechanosensitive channel